MKMRKKRKLSRRKELKQYSPTIFSKGTLARINKMLKSEDFFNWTKQLANAVQLWKARSESEPYYRSAMRDDLPDGD